MRKFFGSMTGRVFATLVIGIGAAGAMAQWVAVNERQSAIEAYRDYYAIERAEQIIMAVDTVPSASRMAYLSVANRPAIRIEPFDPTRATSPAHTPFMKQLATRLGPAYALEQVSERPAACDAPRATSALFAPSRWTGICETVNVRLRDGDMVRLEVLPPRVPPKSAQTDYSITITLFTLSIALLAYAVARMSTRPLKRLAEAARALGEDINREPLKPAGASEIRQATAAFNAMQARIRQHIAQRTQMLAAITHDLQTPLTRLRLRLEKVQDHELQERLRGDLDAMQAMVREGLELARSTDTSEAMCSLDLDSLLDSVCSDASDSGQAVTLEGRASMALMGRPMALRRCFGNVIDNAVKYGHQAEVSVERQAGRAVVRIRDRGPGIPEGELARVFEPFYRLEGSRSRESGGTGLGLPIALNIVEQHGGSISLANHPEGGLVATLVLPEYYAGK
ncbi:MAG TPA: ATP-binding protein [Telluria sp.]